MNKYFHFIVSTKRNVIKILLHLFCTLLPPSGDTLSHTCVEHVLLTKCGLIEYFSFALCRCHTALAGQWVCGSLPQGALFPAVGVPRRSTAFPSGNWVPGSEDLGGFLPLTARRGKTGGSDCWRQVCVGGGGGVFRLVYLHWHLVSRTFSLRAAGR